MPQLLSPRRKRPLPLKWEIALALVVKVLLLCAIWALWFDQPVPGEDRTELVSRVILNR